MRAGYIWIVAGLIGAVPASAQGVPKWGLFGGVALGDFHGADAGNTVSHAGAVAGVFMQFHASEIVVIEPQVLYVQKGAESDVSGGINGSVKLDYIEVPVLIKANFPVASDNRIVPSIFAGPALAFKVGCHLTATTGSTTTEVSCSEAGLDPNTTDFSLVLGAGADVGPVVFQLRYDLGLSKIVGGSDPPDVKNKAWLFTVGFSF